MQFIPLTSDYCSQQVVTLNGADYDLTIKWNDLRQAWSMDITDDATGNPLAYGVPLLLGGDVLAGFGLGIGSLFLVDTGGDNVDAGSEDLGSRVAMFYAAPGEAGLYDAG